jgi:hypothetical protein
MARRGSGSRRSGSRPSSTPGPRGLRALCSRPAEAELGLLHVRLGDLLDDVLDVVLPALPGPRRRALEVALLREDEGEDGLDPRTLGLARRSALQALAGDSHPGRDRRRPVARRRLGARAGLRPAAVG